MHTTTATQTVTPAGASTELLSGILGMEIRNEEKITAQDRIFCERQQELLYKTLDQMTAGTVSLQKRQCNTAKATALSTRKTES